MLPIVLNALKHGTMVLYSSPPLPHQKMTYTYMFPKIPPMKKTALKVMKNTFTE